MKQVFRIITLLIFMGNFLSAQNQPKFSGLMFGDYFYNINNVDGSLKNLNGFQFRRIYFTADISVSDNFDARFRTETDQSAASNTSGGKLGVMVKDAYLKWKGIFNGSDLFLGISPTPAFDISEGAWGYRALEKTTMDLNGIVPSRDLGVDLKGKITENGSVNYWLKIADNSGNAPETDKYKRYYALVQIKPADGFQATLYYDLAAKADVTDAFDKTTKSNNATVAALFLNYQQKSDFALGFEGFTRTILNGYKTTGALMDQKSLGLSFWAWVSLSEKFRLVARYDSYDPNTDLNNDGTSLLLAGLDYKVAKNVSIIPNIEIFTPQTVKNTNGSSDSSNLQGRVTFSFTF
ncbi:MAG: porin [Melioribacteraceae bacterium]